MSAAGHAWPPSTLTGVPSAAVTLGPDTLLGITGGATPALARYDAPTQALAVVVTSPWASGVTGTAGMAVVR